MAFIRNVDKLIEGLENKFFTEARAKAALAPELAAEETARLAGDAAEAAARQAADSSLDQRLQVIEGSGEGSVAKAEQDAKDYADQKVAALVNSAPEVLDTLKELSDALGGDQNFAATVAGQIGVVDAKVEQEILDRQSAVSAEQSAREAADQGLDGRLDILEQDPTTKSYVDSEILDLQGQITQEISDRQSAVSSEESARQLADNNLSGRISVLEQDPTTKAYVDGEVSDLQSQINQEISDRQADINAEESRAIAAEGLLDGRLDVLEQDPTTKSYVDQEVSSEESRAMQAEQALDGRLDILEQDPTTKSYVDSKVLMLQGEVGSEESRAMAAESALDGRLDILEQDPTTKTYVDGEVLNLQGQITQEISDRQADVNAEEQRAMSAESALDARLDIIEGIDSVEGSIAKAKKDAKDYADSLNFAMDGRVDVLEQDPTTKSYVDGIQSALDARLDIVEGSDSVEGSIAKAEKDAKDYADSIVDSEEQRAMSAESALDGRLDILESDPVTKTYVDGEVLDLQGQVNTEKGRIDAILSASEADKDSFAEIVQLINSVDTTNDSAFAAYVLSNDAALAQEISDRQADVNAEESRAMAAEGLLDGRLDVLESDPTTKSYVDGEVSDLQSQITQEISNRQSDVNAEESRALAAEGLLDGRLDILETDPTTKTYVDGQISSEQSARQSADIRPGVYSGGNKNANFQINLANGAFQEFTLSASVQVTLANPVVGGQYTFKLIQDGVGSRQITWPSIQWFNGTAPVLSGANKIDFVQIVYDGSTYYGSYQLVDVTFATSSDLSSQVAALQAEDLTMFKKDGSRQLTGNVLFSAESYNIGASGANRPNNLYVKTSVNLDSLTASRVMVSDASKNMISSSVTSTELGYLSGVTSSVQTQLNTEASARSAEDLTMFKKDGSRVMAGNMDMGNYAINNIGDINMLGGQKVKYSAKAANYTLVANDYVIAVSDLSASRVMTLPSASSVGAGKVFIIKDQSGAASQSKYIQIAPQSGQQIDGQSDYKVVMPYESVMIVSNGSHWFII